MTHLFSSTSPGASSSLELWKKIFLRLQFLHPVSLLLTSPNVPVFPPLDHQSTHSGEWGNGAGGIMNKLLLMHPNPLKVLLKHLFLNVSLESPEEALKKVWYKMYSTFVYLPYAWDNYLPLSKQNTWKLYKWGLQKSLQSEKLVLLNSSI